MCLKVLGAALLAGKCGVTAARTEPRRDEFLLPLAGLSGVSALCFVCDRHGYCGTFARSFAHCSATSGAIWSARRPESDASAHSFCNW